MISFPSATGPGGNALGGFVCPDHMPGDVRAQLFSAHHSIRCGLNTRHPFGRDISAREPGMDVLLRHAELFGQCRLATCVFNRF